MSKQTYKSSIRRPHGPHGATWSHTWIYMELHGATTYDHMELRAMTTWSYVFSCRSCVTILTFHNLPIHLRRLPQNKSKNIFIPRHLKKPCAGPASALFWPPGSLFCKEQLKNVPTRLEAQRRNKSNLLRTDISRNLCTNNQKKDDSSDQTFKL